jgi:MFS transporter, ACS family, hexuronate transporter
LDTSGLQSGASALPPTPRFVVHGLRWWIAGLIFFATLINFIDRLTISILAPVITTQLHLTNFQFARLTTWFLVAYTISQGVSGKVYDRIGPRRGFTISILIWSVAACAHAFARGLVSLSSFRFILGIGEAGNWPGAARVIADWFPVRQRAIGMGIFNSGVCVGSILAPPLIVWLQLTFGWQATFLFTGSLGFIWLTLWLIFYESPERQRAITPEEYALIKEGQPSAPQKQLPWLSLLRFRQTWAIVLSRFLTDPVWWLYVTWLPLYLFNARGFDLKRIGMFAWMPFLTADAGSLLGGWLSGHLISRGWTTDRARKAIIVVGALCMTAGIPAAFTRDAFIALGFISLVTFGFQAWINNVQTLPSDFFPTQAVGAVAGLGGVGAGIGSILYVLTTGWVVDHFSYNPILVTASVLPLFGTVLLFLLSGHIKPIMQTELEKA